MITIGFDSNNSDCNCNGKCSIESIDRRCSTYSGKLEQGENFEPRDIHFEQEHCIHSCMLQMHHMPW
jgi:hypothetical protein